MVMFVFFSVQALNHHLHGNFSLVSIIGIIIHYFYGCHVHLIQVVLAANDLPSINDVTYPELIEIIAKVITSTFLNMLHYNLSCLVLIRIVIYQLKDEKGQLVGVDTSNLLIANSGNDLPVRNSNCCPVFMSQVKVCSLMSGTLNVVVVR